MATTYLKCSACSDALPLSFEATITHMSSHIKTYQSLTTAMFDQLLGVLPNLSFHKDDNLGINLADSPQLRAGGDGPDQGEGRQHKCPVSRCSSNFARKHDLKRHYEILHYPLDEKCPACTNCHFSNAYQLLHHKCENLQSTALTQERVDRETQVKQDIRVQLGLTEVEVQIVRAHSRKRKRGDRARSTVSTSHRLNNSPTRSGTSSFTASHGSRESRVSQVTFVELESAASSQEKALDRSQNDFTAAGLFGSNEGFAPLAADSSTTGLGASSPTAQGAGATIAHSRHPPWQSGEGVDNLNQMIPDNSHAFPQDGLNELPLYSQFYNTQMTTIGSMWNEHYHGNTGR